MVNNTTPTPVKEKVSLKDHIKRFTDRFSKDDKKQVLKLHEAQDQPG